METQATQSTRLVRGTLILTFAVLISKILGFIYVIPLSYIIGLEGLTLLTHGFAPYSVLLSITTLGIPLAVSKYVATNNQLGDYRKGKRLLRLSFYLMLSLGIFMYTVVFFVAPLFADFLLSPESVWIIRASASALLIVPAMAVLRGYFQGWQSMGPTGASQVVEQLVRVVFFVLISLVFVKLGFSLADTVAVASLGTLLGALAALVVLLVYWFKRREGIHKKVLSTPKGEEASAFLEYRELLCYALPISFVSLAVPLFTFIDLVMFKPLLYAMGYTKDLAFQWFGILSNTAQKLIMVPVSIGTAFAIAVLPSITQAFVRGNQEYIKKQTEQSILMLLYVTLPASVGIFVLAEPLYSTLYGNSVGVAMLQAYTPAAVGIGLYTLTASILQALSKIKWSVIWLISTVSIKIISMPLLMHVDPELGAIHATTLSFLVGAIGNSLVIISAYPLSKKSMLSGIAWISIAALVMGTVIYGFSLFWDIILPHAFAFSILRLICCVLLGVVLYGYLTKKLPWVSPFFRKLNQRIKKFRAK